MVLYEDNQFLTKSHVELEDNSIINQSCLITMIWSDEAKDIVKHLLHVENQMKFLWTNINTTKIHGPRMHFPFDILNLGCLCRYRALRWVPTKLVQNRTDVACVHT